MFGIFNTKVSKKDMVLKRLERAGKFGASNLDLSKITLRYGGEIYKLRKEGHSISTVAINPRKGYYKYYLNKED